MTRQQRDIDHLPDSVKRLPRDCSPVWDDNAEQHRQTEDTVLPSDELLERLTDYSIWRGSRLNYHRVHAGRYLLLVYRDHQHRYRYSIAVPSVGRRQPRPVRSDVYYETAELAMAAADMYVQTHYGDGAGCDGC